MISQRELARRMNVSATTISKAIRNSSEISEDMKTRVWEEARRLGLRTPPQHPAAAADRDSAAKSSKFLAVLHADRLSADRLHLMLYYDGLGEEAKYQDVSLVMYPSVDAGREYLRENDWPAAMRDGNIAGLIFVYHIDPEVVRSFARRFPVVSITHRVPTAGCDHVESDYINGMDRLAGHLADLGHRRIGYLMHSGKTTYENARFGAAVQALRIRGLEAPASLWVGGGRTEETYRRAADAVAAACRQGVTAWMCDSDMTVHRLIPALEALGLGVPEDVSLTGFDNFKLGAEFMFTDRQLTTVQTPTRDMGREAVRMLLRRIETPELPPLSVMLDTPLVVGDTTAPVVAASASEP